MFFTATVVKSSYVTRHPPTDIAPNAHSQVGRALANHILSLSFQRWWACLCQYERYDGGLTVASAQSKRHSFLYKSRLSHPLTPNETKTVFLVSISPPWENYNLMTLRYYQSTFEVLPVCVKYTKHPGSFVSNKVKYLPFLLMRIKGTMGKMHIVH